MYYNFLFAIKILIEFCTRYFDGQTFLLNRRIVKGHVPGKKGQFCPVILLNRYKHYAVIIFFVYTSRERFTGINLVKNSVTLEKKVELGSHVL